MFPLVLAAGPMSLRVGETCTALSFAVRLEASGRVAEVQIHASLIRPSQRLTYEEADALLVQAAPHPLQRLHAWSQVRTQYRQARGAISLSLPELNIKVRGNVPTLSLFQDTPSRQLVAEMMILVGECVGQYGVQHQLPLPYRQQPQPNLPSAEELAALPDAWLRSLAMRRCMPPSTFSVTPAPHASLALPAYVQATSPIRRYTDLVAHYQLKAHLRGVAVPFDAAALEPIIAQAGSLMREATLVERQTKRYWLLEYLRLAGDKLWDAVWVRWLRNDDDLCLILIPELATELVMRRREGYAGERLQVRVVSVDPRQDEIRLKEAGERPADVAQPEAVNPEATPNPEITATDTRVA
jgi:exoribonuclease-2